MASAQTCWAISDGAAGNERQALALAEALGGRVQVWRVAPRPPWSWCAPHLLARSGTGPAADAAHPVRCALAGLGHRLRPRRPCTPRAAPLERATQLLRADPRSAPGSARLGRRGDTGPRHAARRQRDPHARLAASRRCRWVGRGRGRLGRTGRPAAPAHHGSDRRQPPRVAVDLATAWGWWNGWPRPTPTPAAASW